MTLTDIKKKYTNEWVLVDVVKEDKLNQPVAGHVIAHSKDRDTIYEKIGQLPSGFHVATIFTGDVPPKNTAFAF